MFSPGLALFAVFAIEATLLFCPFETVA